MNSKDKADKAAQRLEAEQKARLDREQYESDFNWLMGNAQGRRLMQGWLKKTGVYEQSFTGNSETFFKEGRRSVGLDLLGAINTLCPSNFITMLEEQQNGPTRSNHHAE